MTAAQQAAHEQNVAAMNARHWQSVLSNPDLIVVKGEAYSIGPEITAKWEFRGHSGRKFAILKDGQQIITTNLWAHGRIPASYGVKDNALFGFVSPNPPFEITWPEEGI